MSLYARYIALLLSFLCLLFPVLTAAQTAPVCSFGGLDFTSLSNADLLPNDGTPAPQKYQYALRVCGIVDNPTCTGTVSGGNPEASACMISNDYQTPFVVGFWTGAPAWKYNNDQDASEGVQYILTGQKSCSTVELRTAIVKFTCAESLGEVTVIPNMPQAPCTQIYTIPTPLACVSSGGGPSEKKGGLSGGWVFIIILLVLFTVYVVAGCAYKHYRIGTHGIESCPNIDWWRELPGLLKDGSVFTFRKVTACCGGSQGGGGNSSYATM